MAYIYQTIRSHNEIDKKQLGFALNIAIYFLISVSIILVSTIFLFTPMKCEVYCCPSISDTCVENIAYYSETSCIAFCNGIEDQDFCSNISACSDQADLYKFAIVSIIANFIYIIALAFSAKYIRGQYASCTPICFWTISRLIKYAFCIVSCIIICTYYFTATNKTINFSPFSSITDGANNCPACFKEETIWKTYIGVNIVELVVSTIEYIFVFLVGVRGRSKLVLTIFGYQ